MDTRTIAMLALNALGRYLPAGTLPWHIDVEGAASSARKPDRMGAAADLLHLGQPTTEIGPGQPFRDLALDRHRPQRIQHGQAAADSANASGTTAAGGLISCVMRSSVCQANRTRTGSGTPSTAT